MNSYCPSCGSVDTQLFYSKKNFPVHSVRLLHSKDEAIHFPAGQMDLTFCQDCGFIWNASYDPNLQDYSDEYESTQAYSPTFTQFATTLGQQLVDDFDLHHKKIIEIGCGQGEFISLLCQLGNNTGIGFDPSYDLNRPSPAELNPDVKVIADYYSEKYSEIKADFICCKMTLEHIQNVSEFIRTVRKSVGNHSDTTIFFQVPDVTRILQECAFWDIYYEHCSYFSRGSLSRLFRQEGFSVLKVWRDYGDQYLMIAAQPTLEQQKEFHFEENDIDEMIHDVHEFSNKIQNILNNWTSTIHQAYQNGKEVMLWGSGSKGVAFLTTLGLVKEISFTVDINPNKANTYMAGTGQAVINPDRLADCPPDLVILMNPLYVNEVQSIFSQMDLHPQIMSVGA